MKARRTGGSTIWQSVNDAKSAVGQYLSFCESRGKNAKTLSIFWDRTLLLQHFEDWIAFHEKHNGLSPSPCSLYNRAVYLFAWCRFLYVWKYTSNHHKLATMMQELVEKKKEYKAKLKAYRVTTITAEKRAALDRFLELDVLTELCDAGFGVLQFIIKYSTHKNNLKPKQFAWFQRILLMLTYFLCGMSDKSHIIIMMRLMFLFFCRRTKERGPCQSQCGEHLLGS